MHVGDAEHLDVVGANNAGIAAVLLDPSASAHLRIEDRTARIPSLASVADVARRWALP